MILSPFVLLKFSPHPTTNREYTLPLSRTFWVLHPPKKIRSSSLPATDESKNIFTQKKQKKTNGRREMYRLISIILHRYGDIAWVPPHALSPTFKNFPNPPPYFTSNADFAPSPRRMNS